MQRLRTTIGFCLLAVLCCLNRTAAQRNTSFNVSLEIDYSAAEQTVALYNDQFVSTAGLAELRGNRIAASTTGMIGETGASSRLKEYFDSLKYHQIIRNDIFHLEEGRTNVEEISAMLDTLKRKNFNQRVVATVAQIFPADAAITCTLPMYVVALGHENVDAYVRRIVWHGDTPEFVGEDEGESTIVVNLAKSVGYGRDREDRFVSLLGVVAHEVFHAAYASFKETSPGWKRFYRKHQRPFDLLLDLTQNEGIAYYLSLDQQGSGRLPRDWTAKTGEAFAAFNKNAAELLSPDCTPRRAGQLLRKANLSGFWESYGAMTGMYMARTIDLQLGRAALIEAVQSDPFTFFQTYQKISARDTNLPRFTQSLMDEILKN
jgi:hypothetical protein